MKIYLDGDEIALACSEFVCRRDFGGRTINIKGFSFTSKNDPSGERVKNQITGEVGIKGSIQAIVDVEEVKD